MPQKLHNKLLASTQTVCIDLPGEVVQCWRSTDKVQVVLKKHRDVIFELNLSSGRKYTVESTGSDFYHANKKKIIAGRGRQRVLFDDGDRLHLWVARDFKGDLLLKSDNRLLMRFAPAKLDGQRYDNMPSTKPNPIIIAVGKSKVDPPGQDNRQLQKTSAIEQAEFGERMRPASAPVDEDCPVVCVIDANLKQAPQAVWKALETGGGNTGLADLLPFDVATRNWILGQIAGATAFVGDNWEWLKASLDSKTHKGFELVSAKIHYVKGQAKFYFAGYSKYNAVFGPGGFGSGHEKVMTIFGGTGKISTVIKSTAKGVLGAFKKNAILAFIFGSVATFAEWKADANKDGYDLFASLLMNVIKLVVVALIVAPIVAGILAFIFFSTEASFAVIAVGALTLGVGVIVSFGVEALDKKLGKVVGGEENEGGLSSLLANQIRENVKGNWDYLKKKLLWDYEEAPF